MQRRKFLGVLGMGASVASVGPSTLAASGASQKKGPKAQPDEPRVFLVDDGRHAAPLYQFAPPLTPADFVATVDQLVESGIDTLIYLAGVEGGTALYDSRVCQKWGENVTRWTHPVFYRAARNIRHLIESGHDPLKLIVDRYQEKGIFLIPSVWLSLHAGYLQDDRGRGRHSDFVFDNQQFRVEPDDDPRAQKIPEFWTPRFSFLHAEVRQERFSFVEELLTRYETDGVELNLVHTPPFCKFSQAGELAPILTKWLRDVRRVARQAAQTQQRSKRIYVRIPSSPDAWDAFGYDLQTWVEEELVDGFLCLTAEMDGYVDTAIPVSSAVELTHRKPCRVLAAFSSQLGRRDVYAPAEMTWAAAANAYDQGADGFGFCDHHWTPEGWPWRQNEYQTLRLLSHPDLLAQVDKIYRARSRPKGVKEDWSVGSPPSLPRILEVGSPVSVPIQIADDLFRPNREGKVESVRLRVRLANIESSLNQVLIKWNGRQLPGSLLRLKDLTYRLLKYGSGGPYGYIYEYRLPPEYFPRRGSNTVEVTLQERDPNVALEFQVYDVDCTISYRRHRHFESDPIDY